MSREASRLLVGTAALVALLVATPGALGAAAPTGAPRAGEETGRLILHLDAPKAPAASARRAPLAKAVGAIDAVLRRLGARAEEAIPELGAAAVDPGRRSLGALRRRARRDPAVGAVEVERYRELRYLPSDPALGVPDASAPGGDARQWHLLRSGFPAAWDLSRGEGAEVAVIDSGIDATHHELGPRLSGGLQVSPFAGDEVGHGTHVSGLACGDSDNGYGIASAGFDCSLFVVDSDLSDSSIAAGIVAAANRGSDVISMSFGGPAPSLVLRNAIDYAASRDVVLVAAAENAPTTDQGYPARYLQPPGTAFDVNQGRGLVVTAAQHDGTRADFAGLGNGVTLAAYGSAAPGLRGIFSTWPAGLPCSCGASFNGDGRFAYIEGTSMAAPQVAGAAALIRARRPGISAGEVMRLLKLNASGRTSWSFELGWGILDAGAALVAAVEDVARPKSRVRAPRRPRRPRFKVRIRRRDPRREAGRRRAGVRNVDVFVARGRRRFRRLWRTRKGAIRFRGRRGSVYKFYSRARDRAGNREPRPRRPDVIVRVQPRPR